MRMSIDHRTRYSFSQPQARVVQLLRMTPQNCASQTVTDWTINVNCDARLRDGQDGYGNVTTMLYIDGPISAVEIMVRGEVLTEDRKGLLHGVGETLPPAFFLRSSKLTQADDSIRSLARSFVLAQPNPQNWAKQLMVAIYERIEVRVGRTPKSRTAIDTLEEGWGSVRDKTQLLIALARAADLPARFVSGHCLDGINARGHKSAYCWAEIYVEGQGWIGFDPSTGQCPGESYVRVAVGLDASDATPLSGTRTGGGIEEMDVEVRVKHGQSSQQ